MSQILSHMFQTGIACLDEEEEEEDEDGGGERMKGL